MKSKLTITVASILSVLVLVGVGFAAWVIINPSVQKEQTGNIHVEAVNDYSYSLDVKLNGNNNINNNISFGASEKSTTHKWLTTKDGTAENLTVTLDLIVNYKENGYVYLPQKFNFKIETTNDTDNVFNALREGTKIDGKVTSGKKILTNPTIKYTKAGESAETSVNFIVGDTTGAEIPLDAFTKDDTAHTAKLTVKIVFGWGSDLGGINPYEHYNASAYDEKLATEAAGVLNDLYQLNGVGYKITISGDTTFPTA